jgi:predicted Rossmann fold flavoprotein
MKKLDIAIIGAGAAGCFAGAICGILDDTLKISIFEKTRQPLAKVRISGGGRCNVTHHCFDVARLTTFYPRGQDFLRNVFFRFQPKDMIDWLQEQQVELKVEPDGRMFPTSDNSETIISCFLKLLDQHQVELCLESEVEKLVPIPEGWEIVLKKGEKIISKKVLFATGGLHKSYSLLKELGHCMLPPVPSLFTFDIAQDWIKEMSGVVIPHAKVKIEGVHFTTSGPVLFTHWGLSGPAILKLSAWAARWLFDVDYKARLHMSWLGDADQNLVQATLIKEKQASASAKVISISLFGLPKNFWKAFVLHVAKIPEERVWAHVSKEEIQRMVRGLIDTELDIQGKSLNKEEFVTCGGVALEEINPRTMESKIAPHLYFAGEVLNIDGVTGGFNFQSAWSTAWIASHAMTEMLK